MHAVSKTPPTIDDVRAAAARIKGRGSSARPRGIRRRCVPDRGLRHLAQIREPAVHLVVQGTRRASTTLLSLTPEQRKRGIAAMSAGNHAQGVAYHAGRLGIPYHDRDAGVHALHQGQAHQGFFGARVVLEGATLTESFGSGQPDRAERGARLRPPLRRSGDHRRHRNHRAGDAGRRAGYRHAGRADRPAGGIDQRHRHRGQGAEAVHRDLRRPVPGLSVDVRCGEGREPALFRPSRSAEGIAVKSPGEITRRIVGELVKDIFLVREDEIERAHRPTARDRKDRRRGARAPLPSPRSPVTASSSRAASSASCCRAAISTCACSPT